MTVPGPSRQPRALVCDDDPLIRRVVSDLATEAGFSVLAELDTAPPLIELARSLQPDVIVLDVSLMGMTGIEAIPALREQAPECALIVYSSFDSVRGEALAAGADACLDKTHPDELAAELALVAQRAVRRG